MTDRWAVFPFKCDCPISWNFLSLSTRPHPRSQSHLAGHGGGLEEGGGPGPLGHDSGGGQADGDLAPSIKGGVEVVSIVVDMFTNLKTSGQVFVVSDLEECRQEMTDFF